MSSSFPPGWEKSTMLSEDSPHKASQSGYGGGRKIITSASHRDQGGRGGVGFYDGSAVKDGNSIKTPTPS